jgi:hypothetical protein
MMLNIENQLQTLRSWTENAGSDVLSIYCGVNPAKPENAGKAWLRRVKNSLEKLPEIRNVEGKRDTPLYDQVLKLLEEERPQARTLALFAHRDAHGRLHAQRLDLQVELPVVDLAQGRVDARYGAPYLAPLWFAVDEYQRSGVLLLTVGRWRFFEVFLGEAREATDIFAAVSDSEWQELNEASRKVSDVWGGRSARPGGRYDKLSPKDRLAAKVSTWMHKLYSRLGHLLEPVVANLGISRLVLIGEAWQISHFEGYLSRKLQDKIVARIPLRPELEKANASAIAREVEPALEEAERREELRTLDAIREQPGLWGVDPVLDALQLGRVKRWVLPWSLNEKIWRCEEGFVAATRATAEIICEQPQQVDLREHALNLANEFGADIEFVRGEAERRLQQEMGGMAALVRW